MLFGVPRLRKTLFVSVASFLGCALLVSCGSYSSPSGGTAPSGLPFRAFVSNSLHLGPTGGVFPALEIVDATKDVESASGVSLASALPDAGLMVLSPKKDRTLVVSPSSNRIAVVNNTTEAVATAIGLPGATESLLVWTDDTSAFVALPSAPIQGQPAGAVGRFNIATASVTAIIPIPGAHYLVSSPTGNQILVFSDNSDSVTLLFPALLGTGGQTNSQVPCSGTPVAVCTVSGFDRPVWGVFSADGSTAYIMNCGPECGGPPSGSVASPCPGSPAAASCTSVTVLDMTQSAPAITNTTNVLAGTIGVLQGNMLYVSGTPVTSACDPTASLCGELTALDFSSGAGTVDCAASSLSNCQMQAIPDGYHNRIQMGANGQLFVGSRTCTNLTGSAGIRGCLAIYDTVHAKVVVPAQNGDVTGIAPIPNRSVVYVCQGGGLQIYDTTTDQLQTTQINIIGQAIDVKVVDF
jgi:hypothetical protein